MLGDWSCVWIQKSDDTCRIVIIAVLANTDTRMKETLRCSNTSQPLITDECIFFLLTVFTCNKQNVHPSIWSQARSSQNLKESLRITPLTCRPLFGFVSMVKWCLEGLLFMIYFTFLWHRNTVPAAKPYCTWWRKNQQQTQAQFCAVHQACSGLVAERTGKETRAHTSMQTCS